MARELVPAAVSMLPAIDFDHRPALDTMPAWLLSRLAAASRSEHRVVLRDAEGRRIGETGCLPASLMLSGSMRILLEREATALEAAGAAGPAEEVFQLVADFLRGYVTGQSDERTASVRIEAYLDALEDLPAWTVREAIRLWRCGDCGGNERDYNFRPSEARLRNVAKGVAGKAAGRARQLRLLLAAEPEPEPISEATRAAQAAQLQALARELATRPPEPQRPRPAPMAMQPAPAAPVDRAAIAAELERRRLRREARAAQEAEPAARIDEDGEGEGADHVRA